MTENDYIQRINSMQQEIDEDEELIEQAYNKINELELRLKLYNSSVDKKKVSAAKVKEYENRIEELERFADLFSEDLFRHKRDELDIYLKQIIKLKHEIEALGAKHKIRYNQYEEVRESLFGFSSEIVTRILELETIMQKLKELNREEFDEDFKRLLDMYSVMTSILRSRANEVTKLQADNNRLRNALTSSNGESFEDLKSTIETRNKEIEFLKNKIKYYEHELGIEE